MKAPLRVLAIGHSYVVATNRAVLREAALDREFSISIAAPAFFHGDLRDVKMEDEPAGSLLQLLGLPGRWSRSAHLFHYQGRSLKQLLTAGRFDVVHAWEEPYVLAGFQIARATGSLGNARFCFQTTQNISKRYPPPFSYFENAVKRRTDAWLACGETVFSTMVQRGFDSSRGRILPLPVDTALFRPLTESEKQSTLAELDLAEPVIGFLGRLRTEKGTRILQQAVELLPRDLAWSVLFIGSGVEEEAIQDWARQQGLEDRVRIRLVRHMDVPRNLGAVSILAAPSQTTAAWREQFGRMVIEAFACGIPVLGSNSGELPFVIGDAGRVLPEENIRAWSTAIEELLRDRGLRSRMAAAGLERAQQFSATTIARKCCDFYRWVAAL